MDFTCGEDVRTANPCERYSLFFPLFVPRHARVSFLKKTWENSSKTLKCIFLRFKYCLSTNFTARVALIVD
ncbi:hypothetical protein HMPREF1579_01248 [Gardnerella vaginalis JCP8066]|nr:hypothetical protein HMPREF1579_01248 [Gardnerella vaginalis JCP8066]